MGIQEKSRSDVKKKSREQRTFHWLTAQRGLQVCVSLIQLVPTPKSVLIICLAVLNRLTTNDRMVINLESDLQCELCGSAWESLQHL